jgi:hypothetical protein
MANGCKLLAGAYKPSCELMERSLKKMRKKRSIIVSDIFPLSKTVLEESLSKIPRSE